MTKNNYLGRVLRALSLAALAGLLLAVCPLAALDDDSPMRTHVETLAAPELAGRMTGSEGAAQAADYIEGQLRKLGAVPVPGQDGYRIPFDYTAGSRDIGSWLAAAVTSDDAAEPQRFEGDRQGSGSLFQRQRGSHR